MDDAPAYSIGSNDMPGSLKVFEEAGELIEILSKFLAYDSWADSWRDLTKDQVRAKLLDEIADVRAATDFWLDLHATNNEIVDTQARREMKRLRFHRWQSEQVVNSPNNLEAEATP